MSETALLHEVERVERGPSYCMSPSSCWKTGEDNTQPEAESALGDMCFLKRYVRLLSYMLILCRQASGPTASVSTTCGKSGSTKPSTASLCVLGTATRRQ